MAARAWSRAEWVDQTMPVWRTLVEPVASGVSAAIVAAMRGQMGSLDPSQLPPGLPAGMDVGAMMGQMEPMLARMSASMFGARSARPSAPSPATCSAAPRSGCHWSRATPWRCCPPTSPPSPRASAIDPSEVRLYLAVREAARVRLFAEVPWLGAAAGRRGPRLRPGHQHRHRRDRVGAAVRGPHRPRRDPVGAVGLAVLPEPSAAQRAALGRLETYLALVEGWVDLVAERATSGHLPHAAALGEALRRRRASGGPAERLSVAWSGWSCGRAGCATPPTSGPPWSPPAGPPLRDAPWEHPDVAPTGADLDDPLGYVERRRGARGGDDVDSALDAPARGRVRLGTA